MAYWAAGNQAQPLLIALHTWSGDFQQNCDAYGDWCVENNWNFVFPNFRGPNWTPAGCGSELMVADIVSAVDYAKKSAQIDETRIYLIGGSGGGHAALLLAGRHPEIWTAVSAWCPISDILRWYHETSGTQYADHIERAAGGNPDINPLAASECMKRSPLTYLNKAKDLIIDINTGIHDGHTGSVPVSHSFLAFNKLAALEDQISSADIEYVVKKQEIHSRMGIPVEDKSYGKYAVLFRRISGKVRLTIFNGGHDILAKTGLLFLARQRHGQPPTLDVVFNHDNIVMNKLSE